MFVIDELLIVQLVYGNGRRCLIAVETLMVVWNPGEAGTCAALLKSMLIAAPRGTTAMRSPGRMLPTRRRYMGVAYSNKRLQIALLTF